MPCTHTAPGRVALSLIALLAGIGNLTLLAADGEWSLTGSMNIARASHAIALLSDGRVLVSGGAIAGNGRTSSAEIYNPTLGTWSVTGSMSTVRYAHTLTVLQDGRVLATGGNTGGSPGYLASAEIYDPAMGTWSQTDSMHTARYLHRATLLSDGRVLVTGGAGGVPGIFDVAEIYDPALGTWSTTATMTTGRLEHTATLLSDGRVLVTGGVYINYLASAEIYDPLLATWTVTGSMSTARRFPAASLLPDGRVLVSGGYDGTASLASAELYDPAVGTWSPTGSMNVARFYHTTSVLNDGSVLAAASYGLAGAATAETYDPALGSWALTGSMSKVRTYNAAALLSDGRLLVSGGIENNILASAEIYRLRDADTIAPTITLLTRTVPNAGGWNNSDVAITWKCEDTGGSGLLQTNVHASVSSEGAGQSVTGTCTDGAGNSASDTQTAINVDKTPPSLSPSVAAARILLNSTSVTSTSGATDFVSGIAAESCGIPTTTSVGAKSIICTATDRAGNAASAVASYRVVYRFDGFLQPINDTAHSLTCGSPCPVSVFQSGSTVPVRFQLKDANGVTVESAGLPLWQTPLVGGPMTAAVDESSYSDAATLGGTYRSLGDTYGYNWGTQNLASGFYWRIGVSLDDGENYFVYIGLR